MSTYLDRYTADRRTAVDATRQLAGHLQAWAVTVPDDLYQDPYLARADQARVEVSVDGGRVTFRGLPPVGNRSRWTEHRITVAATAAAPTMARHLTARLLPTYLPQYAEALVHTRAAQAEQAAVHAVAQQLGALVPDRFRSGPAETDGDVIWWRGSPAGPKARAELKVLDEHTAHLEIHWLSVRDAQRILRALFGGPEPTPAATEPDQEGPDVPALPIYRYADLSTAVLPRQEMDTIDDIAALCTTVVRHPWGAWVRVPHPVLDAADLDLEDWAKWPVLREVLTLAGQAGAQWLNLDCDGEVPAGTGLRVHPW